MNKLFQVAIFGLALSAVLAGVASAEPNKKDAVARVYEVNGPRLEFHRAGESDWKPGAKEMAGFVKDHFRTDDSTVAAMELLIGGRVGIKKDTELEILNDGEAGVVDGNNVRKISLKKGGVWAKFNKQEKPLTIQTRGGVMGIKGTEFVVDTSESGESSVALLEGSVDYTDNKGQKQEMVPGQKMRQFQKDDQLYTLKGEPSEVDKNVDEFLSGRQNIANINSVQDAMNVNWANLPADAVNFAKQKVQDAIYAPFPDEVRQFMPGLGSVVNWNSGWYSLPSIPVPNVPGLPGIPGFHF